MYSFCKDTNSREKGGWKDSWIVDSQPPFVFPQRGENQWYFREGITWEVVEGTPSSKNFFPRKTLTLSQLENRGFTRQVEPQEALSVRFIRRCEFPRASTEIGSISSKGGSDRCGCGVAVSQLACLLANLSLPNIFLTCNGEVTYKFKRVNLKQGLNKFSWKYRGVAR